MIGRGSPQTAQHSFLGFVHRRRRGAELFLLVLALAVGIGAYAAVGLGVEGKVPADIVGYGGVLAVLVVAAHIVVRFVAPYADPVLLPVVAALNGLGLAVIHRLDLAYADMPGKNDTYAQQQLVWMTVGVGLFVATLLLLRDHRLLTRFTYTAGLARDRAAAAAAGARRRQDHQRGPDLDRRRPLQLPARRGRQGAAGGRLRRLPRAAPRRPRARRPPRALRRPAPRSRPRSDPRDVAGQPGHPGLPEGPRLQPALLRSLPDHALRRDRAARLAGRRRPAVLRRRHASPSGSSATSRTASTSGSTRWPTSTSARQRPDRRGHVRDGLGRADRPRLRRAATPRGSPSPSPTSSSPRSARSSASPASSP